MTPEQAVMYLDAASERIKTSGSAGFVSDVEAVRTGFILAHDARQHSRWAAKNMPKPRTGGQLEDLARDFGGQVSRGGFEFRH